MIKLKYHTFSSNVYPHVDFRYLRFKEGGKAVVLKMSLKDHCDDDKNHGDEQTNPDAM